MGKIAAIIRLIFVLAVILLCLAAMAWFWAGEQLPRIAEQKFGPLGRSLGITQRILYSARVVASEKELLTPVDAKGEPRAFQVALGESVNTITTRLEEEHFIRSAEALRIYLIYAGLDTRVQAGKYLLSPAMTPVQIAQSLQDAIPAEVEFVILPGWRAEEIAAALPTSGLEVSPAEFMKVVRNPPAGLLPPGYPAVDSVEGFLLPGSYQIKREITAENLVALFIQRFDETVTPDLRDGFAARGLDLSQAVILASLIQREAMVLDEQPIIASVFYNRLAIGMKLDSDPTAQYALGYQSIGRTWWKNPLTRDDLQIDSRYNTYIYPGLPPGPISNPGIDALRAVAYPAQTGYYFFRARCDGSGRHAFSVSYEEHLGNACP